MKRGNGELLDRMEGHAVLEGRTANQLIFKLREQINAEEADLLLINDAMHSYTVLGRVPNASASSVELHTDHLIYWGERRHEFAIPADASAWTGYAH